MRLLLTAPRVALRNCSDCLKHVYNEETGKRAEYPPGSGRPVKRPAKNLPPCQTRAGCAKGAPSGEDGCKELSAKNLAAYRHHKTCKAVGRFPRDSTVERNAMLIEAIEDAARQTNDVGLLSLLGKGGRNGR
ncbi:MAG: hypothetical protein WBC44_13930 [Planctomycetaceae bacterium]